MTAPFVWLTNDPQVAAALTAADRKHEQDREAAKSLPLAAKIAALRKARDDRDAAYASVTGKPPIEHAVVSFLATALGEEE